MARVGRWAATTALTLVTIAWGLWCFLLVHEYVTDDWGGEWDVDLGSTVVAVGLLAALATGCVLLWARVCRMP